MANRSRVPKFGNWESEENVPYTAYFDKARKGRTGGVVINPNDPQENPDAFSENGSSSQPAPSRSRTEPEEPTGQGAVRHERRVSREDGDMRQFSDSPARNDNIGRRAGSEPTNRNAGRGINSGETNRKPVRPNAGSESIERSPLHPHYQGRGTGRVSAPSPSWEGKASSDSSHGTPGRSRLRPNSRGDENSDKGAAVPKFGEWDESNPSSADGFTHIFNKVREERQTGAVRVPGMGVEPSYNTGRNQTKDEKAKGCCFPWSRK